MNDMRRSILWVVFAFSLIMLWDKWQIHQGKPATFFPDPQTQTATHTVPPSPAASAATAAADLGVPVSSAPSVSGGANTVPGNATIPALPVHTASSPAIAQSNLLRSSDAVPAPIPAPAASDPITVQNPDISLRFSPIGGRLVYAELKHYAAIGEKANSPKRMVLFDEAAGAFTAPKQA